MIRHVMNHVHVRKHTGKVVDSLFYINITSFQSSQFLMEISA